MALIEKLDLGAYTDNIEDNKITSVRVIKKATWPALQRLNMSNRMNNAGDNYFEDAKILPQSCFPKMQALNLYSS
jgi:hypothetical protein